MADIISGSSRFNGDKNAPARKVIQMNNVSEAATHETEDDEIVKHRIKKHRRRMVIIAVIGVIVIAIAVVLVMRLIDGYVFTSYSVTGSLNREDIESSGYIAYGDGYIRYSNDGAAYYTAKGKALWNQTYSMQKPQVKICEDCVAIGDINGNTIYIFNKNGNIGKVDTSLVISQIEVAANGAVAAVLEDNEANYINMYDKEGNKIYSVKTTLAGDGYPLDISISNDSAKLIASYVYVSGEEIKTNVVFYNFSEVGQNETERVVGGFNHYNDVLVGDVQFLSNNIAVAVGENVISIYKIKEYPSLEKEIQIDNTIDRVFFGTDYIGLVLDNSDSGELYKMVVYNFSGSKVCEAEFGTQVDNIQFDGSSVVMNNSTSFSVFNLKGKNVANMSFDMPASKVLPTGTRGEYILINTKYIQNIKLK
jgi:hypothetical protein